MVIVKLRAAFAGTTSRGWQTRREKKCISSMLHCLALAFPTEAGMRIDYGGFHTFGIDNLTFTVEFPEDLKMEQIELFVRLAKQVKHFYAVDLIPASEPVTMHP